jgi:hypothetical protein
MVKFIEITPEWVLTEIPQSLYADGNGNISVDTDNVTDVKWIKLALDTLYIPYEEKSYGDDNNVFFDFEFWIEDIKDNCPALYKSMKEMVAKNKIYKQTNLN